MNNLNCLIEMLKECEQQHDAHEYLTDDNKKHTEVVVYSANGIHGPCSRWRFDELGKLLKVAHRKRAFIYG